MANVIGFADKQTDKQTGHKLHAPSINVGGIKFKSSILETVVNNKVAEIKETILEEESIVGKGDYKYFLLFSGCYPKPICSILKKLNFV